MTSPERRIDPEGPREPSAAKLTRREALLRVARPMLGTPYVWGGNVPGKGLDCSGFVQQAYERIGVHLPRVTFDQVHAGRRVQLDRLQPGDLIFTEPGRHGPNHVGMYVGQGQVQESPHHGDVNKLISLHAFLSGGFVDARRILP